MTPEELNLPPVRLGERTADPARGAGPRGAERTLTWFQHEALRIAAERHEVRRRDFMARCGISRELARRQLAAMVELGLLRCTGSGRGSRYVLRSPSESPPA